MGEGPPGGGPIIGPAPGGGPIIGPGGGPPGPGGPPAGGPPGPPGPGGGGGFKSEPGAGGEPPGAIGDSVLAGLLRVPAVLKSVS